MRKYTFFLFFLFSVFFSCKQEKENNQPAIIQADSSFVEAEKNVEEVVDDELEEVEVLRLDTLPLIAPELAKELAPKMKKWLSVYGFDINKFRLSAEDNSFDSGIPKDFSWDTYKDLGSIYHQEFVEKKDDVYLPALYTYSANKKMYVNLVESRGVELSNDTLHYYGGDDCQEIYLTSRDLKKKVMILWLGSGTVMEDCFWIDSYRLALVGITYALPPMAYIHLLDTRSFKWQAYLLSGDESVIGHIGYFEDHNLDSKGFPVKID